MKKCAVVYIECENVVKFEMVSLQLTKANGIRILFEAGAKILCWMSCNISRLYVYDAFGGCNRRKIVVNAEMLREH